MFGFKVHFQILCMFRAGVAWEYRSQIHLVAPFRLDRLPSGATAGDPISQRFGPRASMFAQLSKTTHVPSFGLVMDEKHAMVVEMMTLLCFGKCPSLAPWAWGARRHLQHKFEISAVVWGLQRVLLVGGSVL